MALKTTSQARSRDRGSALHPALAACRGRGAHSETQLARSPPLPATAGVGIHTAGPRIARLSRFKIDCANQPISGALRRDRGAAPRIDPCDDGVSDPAAPESPFPWRVGPNNWPGSWRPYANHMGGA